jgi:hypothetical protein
MGSTMGLAERKAKTKWSKKGVGEQYASTRVLRYSSRDRGGERRMIQENSNTGILGSDREESAKSGLEETADEPSLTLP